ncbi:Stk1 family PASTA domain-containing Ser/Thr kinase [Rhodococcus aerolatus]
MTTPRNLSGRYELGETLGFGGMSEVYSAVDTRLGRDVAVKVLRADLARDPTFFLRFSREAQNAASLNHPAIVAVYDTGEADTEAGPLPYIVMERVDGETLRDVVRGDGPLSPRRAMEVMADVCAALDYSHHQGIVHRDVKPANVMINRAGAVKVMDFGIARAVSDGTSTMTQTASVIGTAQYLSPEQARGQQVDARSDVYSAGCVLFELLTGEPPFTGDSPVAVAYQHVREDPPAPSQVHADVPAALDSIVLKAMSKNPANRYQSAGEMRADLVRVIAGQRPSAPVIMSEEERTSILGPTAVGGGKHRTEDDEDDPVEDERRRRRNRRVLATLATVAVVALAGVLGLYLYQLNGGGRPPQVAIPDVTGQPYETAQTRLTAQGLNVRPLMTTSNTVADGDVIDTDPAAGATVDRGTAVVMRVSTGKEKKTVPSLVDLTLDQATAALQQAGLVLAPNPTRAPSTPEARDKVLNSSPAEGAQLDIGSAVAVVLGSGPAQVRVTDVVGQQVAGARGNLEAAGFVVVEEQVDSPRTAGVVLAQTPKGGTQADLGSTIVLTTSRGNRFIVPDLVGLTPADAVTRLTAAGWTGTAATLVQTPTPTNDLTQNGRVLTQSTAQGTELDPAAPISVTVGAFTIFPAPPSTTTTSPAPTR